MQVSTPSSSHECSTKLVPGENVVDGSVVVVGATVVVAVGATVVVVVGATVVVVVASPRHVAQQILFRLLASYDAQSAALHPMMWSPYSQPKKYSIYRQVYLSLNQAITENIKNREYKAKIGLDSIRTKTIQIGLFFVTELST